jgi:CDP-glycerol glycerophosphotransferase (TagB/SpsB family)
MSKLAVYGDNLDFFRSLDTLVVTEKTSLLLKTRYGLDKLRFVHTRHGAGDRAIGFDPASRKFDHVLASGRKIADRLIVEAGVDPHDISIVGYPKFDIVPPAKRLPMQGNGKPTVLYNPHVSPHLSSWYAHGRAVLEYFRDNPDYNLIFAPHVMLFARRVTVTIDKLRIAVPGRIDPSLYQAPNIHIDLGGPACTDMTYTNAADVYLGDASSQVYEFLRRPRPCIFLDPHRQDYEDDPNFAHWKAGPVITDVAELDGALRNAFATHGDYLATQQELFNYSFDLTGEPSCERAARAVQQFVARGADTLLAA